MHNINYYLGVAHTMGGEILKVLGFSKELKVNSVDLDKDNIEFKFFF